MIFFYKCDKYGLYLEIIRKLTHFLKILEFD